MKKEKIIDVPRKAWDLQRKQMQEKIMLKKLNELKEDGKRLERLKDFKDSYSID